MATVYFDRIIKCHNQNDGIHKRQIQVVTAKNKILIKVELNPELEDSGETYDFEFDCTEFNEFLDGAIKAAEYLRCR